MSAANLTYKHFFPEKRCLSIRLSNSVDLPANIGPIIISSEPRKGYLNSAAMAILSVILKSALLYNSSTLENEFDLLSSNAILKMFLD